MINNIDDLYQVLDRGRVEYILVDQLYDTLPNILSSGWGGIDELDQVEIIMEMELKFNIQISDDLAEIIFGAMSLSEFLGNISSFKRNLKIEDLGI